MVTISISMELKNEIKDKRKEKESMDKILSRLIENCKDIEPYVENRRANIHISEETLSRLNELKGSPKESYGSVILRLINSQ